MKSSLLTLSFVLLSLASFALSKADAVGVWYNGDKDAKIQIYELNGKLYGKIIWLQDPISEKTGKPKVDENNPDPTAAVKPVNGLVIMNDFTYSDELTWENGRLYDPENGKTYGGTLTLVDRNTISLRGYILGFKLLGRKETWVRAS